MKKLLTAIVISALCLGLCSGALAEGENVISADEFNGPAQPSPPRLPARNPPRAIRRKPGRCKGYLTLRIC